MNANRLLTGAVTAAMILGAGGGLLFAQPPGPPPGPPGPPPPPPPPMGMGMLLRAEEVRDELALSEDQLVELRDVAEDLRGRFRDGMRGRRGERRGPERGPRGGQGRRGPRGGGEGFRGEMRGRMDDARRDMEGALSEVLDEEQMQRLREIAVRQQVERGGPHALMHGRVGEELGVTDEQRDAMRKRAEELRRDMGERLREIRREGQQELLGLLTSEQRAQLDAMMGEPFELPEPRWRPDPGGRDFDGPPRRGRGERGRRGPPGSGRRGPPEAGGDE